MVTLILNIIGEGLKLYNNESAKALALRVAQYKEDWNAEIAKGALRNDARLDELDRELLNIGQLFLAILKSEISKS